MSDEKEITRIDFERTGTDVIVSKWIGKWAEGSAASMYDYLPAASIDRLLFECEKQGFTVEMMDNDHGRALRGEITRIDILIVAGKWTVRKFPYGWTAKTRPITEKELSEDQAQIAIAWCKEHGWAVREFPGGARAWKGEVKPVRDTATITRVRRQIEENFRRGEIDNRRQFDLAFDC
jgi:hypothetical protein